MRRVRIFPSILSADFWNLEKQLSNLPVEGIHFDVMDGVFVPNISFGIPVLETLRQHLDVVFDVHLMIANPERWVKEFARAGADIITFHWEATAHPHRVLGMIKEEGKKAGIAINPATPPDVLRYLFAELDLVLVMSVNPGFGGQKFIPFSIDKIRELDRVRKEGNYSFLIEVDGGVNAENCGRVVEAGADILVAGSYTFRGEPRENILRMIKEIEKVS